MAIVLHGEWGWRAWISSPIEREFLRARTTSSRAFHARYTRRLWHSSRRESLKASFTAPAEAEAATCQPWLRVPLSLGQNKDTLVPAEVSILYAKSLPPLSHGGGGERSHGFAAIRYATTTAVICVDVLRFRDEGRETNLPSPEAWKLGRRKRIGSSLMPDENER